MGLDRHTGRVVGIFVTPEAGGAMRAVDEVTALAGRGLEGDRYATGAGSWSDRTQAGRRDLSVFSVEKLDEMATSTGVRLEPREARRNVLVEGLDVQGLVGKQFRVGEAICYAIRVAQPCIYLEQRTRPGVLKALMNRGGVFCEIVVGGRVAVGDVVAVLAPEDEVDRK